MPKKVYDGFTMDDVFRAVEDRKKRRSQSEFEYSTKKKGKKKDEKSINC